MRIWSLHPHYLDSKGLVALWRETLLAQNVLLGKTKGYRNHPQLERFKSHPNPIAAIGYYLQQVYQDADKRGYHFNHNKIISIPNGIENIKVTQGQLSYELDHLKRKLVQRYPKQYQVIQTIQTATPHPLFSVVEGPIESWEKT